jgi:hypothetical protein
MKKDAVKEVVSLQRVRLSLPRRGIADVGKVSTFDEVLNDAWVNVALLEDLSCVLWIPVPVNVDRLD